MRLQAASGLGIEVAFLLLYTYSDTFRAFIDYLVISIFHIAPQDTQNYVVPFAVVLLIVSITIGILGYLNLDILALLKESITKTKVEQPHTGSLEAEIFGEKRNKFCVGDTICFKARYRGNLKNGYFTVKIRPPERHKFRDTDKEYEWMVDYNTSIRNDLGTLSGQGSGWLRKSHTSTWGHKIPFLYPPGDYRATLMVIDPSTSMEPLKELALTFTIVKEDLMELCGFRTVDNEERMILSSVRNMFVRKPRRRSWLGILR